MSTPRVSNRDSGVNSTLTQPPLSNRGVTYGFYEGIGKPAFGLDWVRYSVPWPSEFVREGVLVSTSLSDLSGIAFRAAVMPLDGLKLSGEVLPPPKGYNARLGLTCGSLRFHSDIPGQKIGAEFTGRDLDGLRGLGGDPVEMVKWVHGIKGAKVTRLDLAVDYFGEADPVDIHRAFLAGELDTVARSCQLVEGHQMIGENVVTQGATVYVGSRSSDRFLRVYDKRLEQGGSGSPRTRIELVLGGDRANLFAGFLVADPRPPEDIARAAIREFCWAPTVRWFGKALTGPVVELPKLGRRDSDRKQWLLHQVLPALRAELLESEAAGDWELYAAFREAMAPYLVRSGGELLGAV